LDDLPTTISPGLVILASPQITSILFFFIRKPTPPFRRCGDAAGPGDHVLDVRL
jgi:hypothetical protein